MRNVSSPRGSPTSTRSAEHSDRRGRGGRSFPDHDNRPTLFCDMRELPDPDEPSLAASEAGSGRLNETNVLALDALATGSAVYRTFDEFREQFPEPALIKAIESARRQSRS